MEAAALLESLATYFAQMLRKLAALLAQMSNYRDLPCITLAAQLARERLWYCLPLVVRLQI